TNLQTGEVIDGGDIALDKPDIPKVPINSLQDEDASTEVVTINLS
ncbi:MAG: tRNA 2-thiocytidine(32) synthetase TtcA, partial [Pseudoalteromonas nigrifaciens]